MVIKNLKKTHLTVDTEPIKVEYNIPDNSEAVVLAVHGMMEHSGRYSLLAEPLEKAGFGYITFDLPGHGEEAKEKGLIGLWPDDGFEFCVSIIKAIIDYVKTEHMKKVIIMGHSMGAFLTIKMLGRYGEKFEGSILSGANDKGSALFLHVGILLSRVISFFKGDDYKSGFLYNMAFGNFNNSFKPHRTEYDWLSRNEEEVDKYIDDDLCGFTVSAKLFRELAFMMIDIYKDENISSIPKELPVFLLSGGCDPVGDFGKGPILLSNRLKNKGLKNVECKVYENGRHESINEINREEVIGNIISFCRTIA